METSLPQVAPKLEANTDFSVILKGLKDAHSRLNLIKQVRKVTMLDLQAAKALVDGAPKLIKRCAAMEEAFQIKTDVEAGGGIVEIRARHEITDSLPQL